MEIRDSGTFTLAPAVGSRIIVAGGCGGIGRAFVAAALDAGLEVAVLDRESALAMVAPMPELISIACDASDECSVVEAFGKLRQQWGSADALVNLVGFTKERLSIESMPASEWDEILSGTLRSAFLLSRAAIPLLKSAHQPAIVHTSGTLGFSVPTPGYGPYAVAKAGVSHLTRVLATECAPRIRVNAVAPGPVETPFLQGGTARPEKRDRLDIQAYVQRVPQRRIAHPDDIVGPMMFLIGPASAHITGQTVHVNGGVWS